MENIRKYSPLGLVIALVIKSLIVGMNFAEMGVVVSIVSFLGLIEYLDKNKKFQEVKESALKSQEETKSIVNKQNDVIAKMADEVTRLRSDMSGLKLKNDFKGLTNGNK